MNAEQRERFKQLTGVYPEERISRADILVGHIRRAEDDGDVRKTDQLRRELAGVPPEEFSPELIAEFERAVAEWIAQQGAG